MKKKVMNKNTEYMISLILSITAALLIGAMIMIINGNNPISGYAALLEGALSSKYKIATTLAKTVPLILTGLATAISFKSGIFNIGGEGQLYLGAFAAAYVGFTFTNLPPVIGILLAMVFAAIIGGLYAMIPAILKVKHGIDEVIVTIMMSSVAILFTNYLVNYPFAADQGKMGGTNMIAEGYRFSKLVKLSKLNTSIFITIFIALAIYYLMEKTSTGYNFSMVGQNPIFARYGGVGTKKHMIWSMIISGGLCGITGAFEVFGTHYRFLQNISPGYYFDGMLVALIVRSNPIGVVFMSLFFAILKTGSTSMEVSTGIPSELILVIQAIIILFIAGERGFKKIFKEKFRSKNFNMLNKGAGEN
jgi:simple sugar transport system permease protein